MIDSIITVVKGMLMLLIIPATIGAVLVVAGSFVYMDGAEVPGMIIGLVGFLMIVISDHA